MSHQRAEREVSNAGAGALSSDAQVQFEATAPAAAMGQSAELNQAEPAGGAVRRVAAAGIAGSGGPLPHQDRISAAFGPHDISGVKAHVGGAAAASSELLGAHAYAHGNDVAFAGPPDLHLAAHEAAHVVQQRNGVRLKDAVGRPGDTWERHADSVADAVVAGRSAAPLLDAATGGGGGEAPVQADLLDGVMGLGQRVAEGARDLYERAVTWIDLLGPKNELLDLIRDTGWVSDGVSLLDTADPNPEHADAFWGDVELAADMAGLDAQAFADRIASCNSRDEVSTLREEYLAFRDARKEMLAAELDVILMQYTAEEAAWLQNYASFRETADPVRPNEGNGNVSLTVEGGAPEGLVTVETRVNCDFQMSPQGQQDSDGDGVPDGEAWTDEEKAHFMSRFQEQLDHIWTTGAGQSAPFAVQSPQDHLLENETPKWSELTANLQAQVTTDATSPHFQLRVIKPAPGEATGGAFVDGNGAGAQFWMGHADRGLDANGDPNGRQMTLAHEWHHMIGNPDEYAESSERDRASSPAGTEVAFDRCEAHFVGISGDEARTDEDRQQARDDLQSIRNHATAPDPARPGHMGIYDVANRPDIPDDCFAVRGVPDPRHRSYTRLRPGARSQRGGTNISASAEDAARLSDRGNNVHPYMREGIVSEVGKMLDGKFTPPVVMDHNFAEMELSTRLETLHVRIQNLLHDLRPAMGATQEASGEGDHECDHDH